MNKPRMFHEFAAWVSQERKRETFIEAVLQHRFVTELEATVWTGLANGRLKPRNSRTADIVLYDRRSGNVCLAVELKNAGELSAVHRDQARRYSEEHYAPCILTNGLEYRVILSLRAEGDFSHAGLEGRRTNTQSMDIQLGEIDPRRYHDAIERQLQEFFLAAFKGRREVNEALERLAEGSAFHSSQNVLRESSKVRMIAGKEEHRHNSRDESAVDVLFDRARKPTKRVESDEDTLKTPATSLAPPVPSFKPNSAISVARAIKRELKGMAVKISEDSVERSTICMGQLQIVRITPFQLHCRISIRQPEDRTARGTDVTGKGWRTDTIASRDIESIREAAALVRKLWDA